MVNKNMNCENNFYNTKLFNKKNKENDPKILAQLAEMPKLLVWTP
jgi:hypothetical protein